MSGPLSNDDPRHAQLMEVAIRRAMRAVGRTAPNPCVGAVVARDGRILAVGHHARAGTAHAEVVALQAAGPEARGADLYVTLEPCSHHGRTPPCADAILAAGISRVFVAVKDPNPKVNGQGIARLRAGGITVVEGVKSAASSAVLEPFFHWIETRSPQVILKAAVSLDGRLAPAGGVSTGMSGPRAHAWLHRLRDRVDAIVVGRGTVALDDPQLTPRRVPVGRKGVHRLVRVVVDSRLETAPSARVFNQIQAHPTWVFCALGAPAERRTALEAAGAVVVEADTRGGRVSLAAVMKHLGSQGLHRVLVEGGSRIHQSLLEDRLATHAELVVVPLLLGTRGVPLTGWQGPQDLAGAVRLTRVSVRRLGDDTLVAGCIRYPA